MQNEKPSNPLTWVKYHLVQSNWLPYILLAVAVWYGWDWINNLIIANDAKDALIAQQQLQLDLNQEYMNTITSDIYERLDNVDSAKDVANEQWVGNRVKDY